MTTTAIPEHVGRQLAATPKAQLVDMLYQMLLGRRYEEKCAEMYALQKIGGFCHLYIGQEAVAIGALSALRPDDLIITAYREHVHALVKGCDPGRVMAELFGRRDGVSRGKGGSMHCSTGEGHARRPRIVSGHIPLATGTPSPPGISRRRLRHAVLLRQAAVNIGTFHESLNMAALWKLPVIYIVENNRFGMGTAIERSSAIYDVAQRACAYDMASETVDGMDVLAMREVIGRAVDLARRESLPTLIEARCYRFMGHSMSDPVHGHYRTKEEVEGQKQQDPIAITSIQKAGS
jgi:pyruvate dehydrogenase E1 component alpha subunit